MMNTLTRRTASRGTLNEFDSFLQNMLAPFTGFAPEFMGTGETFPRMEVETGKDAVTVRLPLPGFRKADIEAEIVGNVLTIRAKRGECPPLEGTHYLRKERTCTEYEETVRLPAAVKPGDAKADYKDGVLTITLPREPEAAESHVVKVQ